ncbi:hypothetical protein LCGC14_1369270 [marine sediment metagenome]
MDSQREYWIKNMVCSRCLKVIKQELEEIGVEVLSLELGKLTVRITAEINKQIDLKITEALHSNGFEIAKNEEEMIVENIKIVL